MTRAFAVIRSAFFWAVFVSLWTWYLPRWIGRETLHVVRAWAWPGVVIPCVLSLWCGLEFAWRGDGTPMPADPPRRLVITGLYRYVRNPMYLAFLVTLLSEAVLVGKLVIVYEAIAFVALVTLLVMTYEEPSLRRSFGDDYRRYCEQVPRWIPRLRRLG